MDKQENAICHRSTMRVLEIIEFISSNTEGYTLTQLSTLLSAPKSSLWPIVQTLYKNKYLSQNHDTNKYRLGLMSFKIGQRYLEQINIMDIVREEMVSLTNQCSETSYFGILANGYSHYLVKVDSPEPIRMFASAGKQLPAYSTGLGKALLSGCTHDELAGMYSDGLAPVTDHTILDLDALERQLEQVRSEGFAYESEESTLQIRCIAVPIKKGEKVIAGLSVAMPLFRYSEEKSVKIKKMLLHAKSMIENAVVNLNMGIDAFE